MTYIYYRLALIIILTMCLWRCTLVHLTSMYYLQIIMAVCVCVLLCTCFMQYYGVLWQTCHMISFQNINRTQYISIRLFSSSNTEIETAAKSTTLKMFHLNCGNRKINKPKRNTVKIMMYYSVRMPCLTYAVLYVKTQKYFIIKSQ